MLSLECCRNAHAPAILDGRSALRYKGLRMNNPDAVFYEQVGKRIQSFRIKSGLTQRELGERLDPPVTRASVANLESGTQRILLHTFVQLLSILECKVTELIPSIVQFGPGVDDGTLAVELGKLELSPNALVRIRRELISRQVVPRR